VRIQVLADLKKEKLRLEHQACKEMLGLVHVLTMQQECFELGMVAQDGPMRSSC
jgi:hypothetical protein